MTLVHEIREAENGIDLDLVKEIKEKLLPDVTDEWASEASEFETVEELRDDIRMRLVRTLIPGDRGA